MKDLLVVFWVKTLLYTFYAKRLLLLPWHAVRGHFFPRKFSDQQPEFSRLLAKMLKRGKGCIAFDKGGYAYRDRAKELKLGATLCWIDVDPANQPKPRMTEHMDCRVDNSRYAAILRAPACGSSDCLSAAK